MIRAEKTMIRPPGDDSAAARILRIKRVCAPQGRGGAEDGRRRGGKELGRQGFHGNMVIRGLST